REQVPETVSPDVALADIRVAVDAAPERALRVVRMYCDEPLQPHVALELVQHLIEAGTGPHVVAGGERMLDVDADLHPIAARLADYGAEFRELRADGAAHSRRVLQDHPRVVRGIVDHLAHGLHHLVQLGVIAGAHMAAEMEDHALRTD